MRKFLNKPYFIRAVLFTFMCCSATGSFAQQRPETTGLMRSEGKIYVVVAVCVTILIGLFLYVFSIDRKVRKLEKENK